MNDVVIVTCSPVQPCSKPLITTPAKCACLLAGRRRVDLALSDKIAGETRPGTGWRGGHQATRRGWSWTHAAWWARVIKLVGHYDLLMTLRSTPVGRSVESSFNHCSPWRWPGPVGHYPAICRPHTARASLALLIDSKAGVSST